MQATIKFSDHHLDEFVDEVFRDEAPHLFSTYSEYGCEIERFDASKMKSFLRSLSENHTPYYSFSCWYPTTKGHAHIEKILLDPTQCDGHDFRYNVGGWGIISFQFNFKNSPDIECRITVNSEERTTTWEAQYPQYKSASLWDWKMVEKHTRRIIRKIKKFEKEKL